jgi:hypothetical protein
VELRKDRVGAFDEIRGSPEHQTLTSTQVLEFILGGRARLESRRIDGSKEAAAPSICLSSKHRRNPLMGDFETLRNCSYALTLLDESGHHGASQPRTS